MLWGWAHRCSSFKTLNVIAGAGQCVHCNLSLSSNLSANAPSHPLSSCSSSSFTSSCSTSLPSVLLSSLSRSPRPSVFFLFFFFSPLSPRRSSPPRHVEPTGGDWVSSRLLPPQAPWHTASTQRAEVAASGGADETQRPAWTHLSFLGSQRTSGLMSHWIITVCGIVCDTLWVFIYGHPNMCFYLPFSWITLT